MIDWGAKGVGRVQTNTLLLNKQAEEDDCIIKKKEAQDGQLIWIYWIWSELEVKAAVNPERPFSKLKKVLPLGQLLLGLLITPLFEFKKYPFFRYT